MELLIEIGNKSTFFPLYGLVKVVGDSMLADQLNDAVNQKFGKEIAKFTEEYFSPASEEELTAMFEPWTIDEVFSIDAAPIMVIVSDTEEQAIQDLIAVRPSVGNYVKDNIACPDLVFPEPIYDIQECPLSNTDYIAKLVVYSDAGEGVLIISKSK